MRGGVLLRRFALRGRASVHLKRNAVGENKTEYRASRNAGQVSAQDREGEVANKKAHQHQVSSKRNHAGCDVELRQSPHRLLLRFRGPVVPRPSLMPDKVIQDRQFNSYGGRREVTKARSAMGENKKRARLQNKANDADQIKFYPVKHGRD